MSFKEKESKTINARFRDFFVRKGLLGSSSGKSEFTPPKEVIHDISKESPLSTRLKTLKELKLALEHEKLANNTVEKLWSCTEDLFNRENSQEARHLAFNFMQCLVRSQNEHLTVMRAQFFRLIKHHDHPEDIGQKLQLLIVLTSNGKIILFFEEEIGRFLLNWLPEISRNGLLEDYLNMLDNVIKYNAAYLDEEIINGFIEHICIICGPNNQPITVNLCLNIMSSIVAYSNMSPDALPKFIGALCRTVIDPKYCEKSWQVMKNLLGTHMGHSSIYTMCRIMQEPALKLHIDLLRGAVFFTRMGLWTVDPLPDLRCPPSSILPSFLQALRGNHAAVAYEVSLAVQQLIKRCGVTLLDSSWSIILRILSEILHISNSESNVMVTIDIMENLIELGQYNGDLKSFYKLIEECAMDRSDESVLKLLEFLSTHINPTQQLWLTNLYNLLHKYFKTNMRTTIRLKVLQRLSDLFKLYSVQYEDDLIERIVIPHLSPVVHDNDIIIRTSVIQALIDMCGVCDSKRCLELVDILEKFLHRPFEYSYPDQDFQDIICLVKGLSSLFIKKIYIIPSSHAIQIFTVFVKFLAKHYDHPIPFAKCYHVRYIIYDCFLKMRADSTYHLGYPDGNLLIFSPYLCVVYKNSQNPPPQSPALQTINISYLSFYKAFKVIITCLKCEKDWEVLNLVLNGITKSLQNKSLIIGNGNNDIEILVNIICSMVSDKTLNLPESLNSKIIKSDFYSIISLVLVNLASYHSYFDNASQTKLIRCVMKCISYSPKSSKLCISALTICTLEMKEVMVKVLPLVLLDLSKMSPTNHVAVPVLEFLSTMTQLPTIFSNFVSDQYMAVFAVALAYSNPFKFDHYVVSLAHHVIAVWFLKCRLNFRRDFVSFIITGLKMNLQAFDETIFPKLPDLTNINQDSSDRKRSSSLTERGSRKRDERSVQIPIEKNPVRKNNLPNKQLNTFYEELNETCIDLMARYSFSPCSALPRRSSEAEFLLNGGQTMSWLIGNKLVTITTSGCSQKVLKQGLCDKCWSMCNSKSDHKLLTAGGSSSVEASRQNSNNSANSPQEENAGGVVEELVAPKLQEIFVSDESKEEKYACVCWCQGWAEVYVRRSTGDMSWIMRIQNDLSYTHATYEFPLIELSNLYAASHCKVPRQKVLVRQDTFDEESSLKQIPSQQNSEDSVNDEDNEEIQYENGTKARNPVRRSNSSPEMSAGWKNPFQKLSSSSGSSETDSSIEEKKGKIHSKDMRVSCEAIPEEIAGTSPPQNENNILHPTLLSYHSFPGSSAPDALHQHNMEFSNNRPATLPNSILSGLQSLTAKPPPSPTQTSPRLTRHIGKGGQELQKSSSSSVVLDRNNSHNALKDRKTSVVHTDSAQPFIRRDRTNTVSVMSRPRPDANRHQTRANKELPKSGVCPSFVFLQLYHSSFFNDPTKELTKPLLIGTSDVITRSVKILDNIPPYETHTVGVLYIREGQVNNEAEILKNSFGSLRYIKFLQNLGNLMKVSDAEPQLLRGLDRNGEDGKFVYIWQDDVVRVTFHVATMMPNKETDPSCNNKKMHIGNDFVNIVYNESGEEFDIKTIKSQFNFANIVIQPLDHGINKIVVKIKDELKDFAAVGNDAKVVSDQNVAILARQLSLHANLASLVARSLQSSPTDPYASNWLERLRQIKNIRKKVVDEQKNQEDQGIYPSEEIKNRKPLEDFTEYS